MLTLPEIALILEEVNSLCGGGAVQKVLAADGDGHVLRIRTPGVTHWLLLDYSSTYGRVCIIRQKPPQPETPKLTTMALRNELEGSRFLGATCDSEDRIVRLNFKAEGPRQLVIELTGRVTRATLLSDGVVLQPLGGNAQAYKRGTVFVAPSSPPATSRAVRWELDAVPVGARSIEIETAYADAIAEDADRAASKALVARVRRELKRRRRLLKNLEQDLANAEAAIGMRKKAELLQAAYGKVEKGDRWAEVQDFYDPDLPTLRIALEPQLTLQENIDKMFHAYRRLKSATPDIEDRILEAMSEIEVLESALASCAALTAEEASQIEMELASRNLLTSRSKKKARQVVAPRLPYRSFLSRSGKTILVGRGAKDNDALTTKIARGRDVWLHARDWAGSHVLLRLDKNQESTGEDLLDAALLAAHFSKGSADSLVDVTHTLAKHVRKPKGFGPGLVTVSGGSTMTVNPSDPLLQQVMKSENKK